MSADSHHAAGSAVRDISRAKGSESRWLWLYISSVNQVALQAILHGERRVFGSAIQSQADHYGAVIATCDERLIVAGKSPVASRLPLEVLHHIFSYTVDGDGQRTVVWRRTLAEVCRHWRIAMRSCPALWQDLHLCSEKENQNIEFAVNHASRAGNPSLVIRQQSADDSVRLSYRQAILRGDLEWKAFYLQYGSDKILQDIFQSGGSHQFAACRRLHIAGLSQSPAQTAKDLNMYLNQSFPRGTQLLFQAVPVLRDLTLEGICVYDQMLRPSLVRLNLVHVNPDEPSTIRLLTGLLSLRSLSISHDVLSCGLTPLAPDSVHLLSLETLVISGFLNLDPLNDVLQSLLCPRLHSLGLEYYNDDQPSCERLRDIVQQKQWNIRHFVLGYTGISTWTSPLAAMRSLQTFAAKASRLSYMAQSGLPPCPHLETVVFYDFAFNNQESSHKATKKVVQAVRLMINGGLRLRRVHLLQSFQSSNTARSLRGHVLEDPKVGRGHEGVFGIDAHYKTQRDLAVLMRMVEVYTTWNDSPFLGCTRTSSPDWPTYDSRGGYVQ